MSRSLGRFAIRMSFLLPVVLFAMSSTAFAQPGIRGGVSIDPDQVYFGAHYEFPELTDRLYFRPNIELGLGDDVTATALNLEFLFKFPHQRNSWWLYAGGGPAANFYRFDRGNGNDETNTEAGLNLIVGAEHSKGLMFELKFGLIDSPEFKFGVGWTFR